MNLFSANWKSALSKLVSARQDNEQYFSPRADTQFVAAGEFNTVRFCHCGPWQTPSLLPRRLPWNAPFSLERSSLSSCTSPAAHELQHEGAAALLLQTHLVDVHIAGGKTAYLAAFAISLPLLVGQMSLFPLQLGSTSVWSQDLTKEHLTQQRQT